MGESMERGHVLVMSLWDDHSVNMLWLDSNYPLDRDPSEPGVSRGSCPTDSGDPDEGENNNPDATTHFSKIRVGAPYCTVLYCTVLYCTCLLYCALQIGCLGCTYPGG